MSGQEKKGWRSPGEKEAEEFRKRLLIAAGVVGTIVAVWLVVSRPGEEVVSSRGFSVGGVGGVGAVSPVTHYGERREQTGLAMVRLNSDFNGAAPPPSAPAPLPNAAPTRPAGPPPVAAVDVDTAQLAGIGVPTDPNSLQGMVDQRGPLSKLAMKVFSYPAAVHFLLNNKIIINGLFSREAGKKACENASALTAYLTNGADPKGVSEEVPIIRALLKNPASAAEAVNSDFGKRVMDCPSIATLKADSRPLAGVLLSNPSLLSVMADPAAVNAVSGNQQAAGLFDQARQAVGMPH